jgi:hypothetical protein
MTKGGILRVVWDDSILNNRNFPINHKILNINAINTWNSKGEANDHHVIKW